MPSLATVSGSAIKIFLLSMLHNYFYSTSLLLLCYDISAEMTNVNSAAGADRVEKKINVVKKFDCLQLCPEVMFVMFNE